jgi:hypothetical protein
MGYGYAFLVGVAAGALLLRASFGVAAAGHSDGRHEPMIHPRTVKTAVRSILRAGSQSVPPSGCPPLFRG